ncbi:prepilin peptidase, partial [Francisella tularensis subsp. holarctica]|nr:prepilin peptidase [Francisella tularensis subsp. holarctica]
MIYLFIFLFGDAIGSYLNVVIYREPNKLLSDEQAIAREILG